MKYLMILDDVDMCDFEHDAQFTYDKETGHLDGIKIKIRDKNLKNHAVFVKPLRGPAIVVFPDGKSAYITQGDIDAMIDYERNKIMEDVFKKFNKSIEDLNNSMVDLKDTLEEVKNGNDDDMVNN